MLFRNQIKNVENVWFFWYLICKTRCSKMVKKRYSVFYGKFENEQKKDKNNLTFRSRDSNPRFSVIFPPMIWIFMESEWDELLKEIGLYLISCSPDPTTNSKTKYESLISQNFKSFRLFLTKINWQKRLEKIAQIREQMLVPDLHVLTLKLHSNFSL